MLLSKTIDLKEDFAAGAFLSEAPLPPRFVLGWCSNFVGSESDQKQSIKFLQNMVSNTTQLPPLPPPSHTLSVYCEERM